MAKAKMIDFIKDPSNFVGLDFSASLDATYADTTRFTVLKNRIKDDMVSKGVYKLQYDHVLGRLTDVG